METDVADISTGAGQEQFVHGMTIRHFSEAGLSLAATALISVGGLMVKADLATMSLLYLSVVLVTAVFRGFWHASALSVLSVCSLDFFFTPPQFHLYFFSIQDGVTLVTFQGCAVLVSRMSTISARSLRDAAARRIEMNQLFEFSRNALLMDFGEAPGPQLAALIRSVFPGCMVAIFDANNTRHDTSGLWQPGEEDIARQTFLMSRDRNDEATNTFSRCLHAKSGVLGAIALRGELALTVVDAISSLTALSIDRHLSVEKEERANLTRESEQLRSAVMDALAHEFKTPLSAIQTASAGIIALGSLSEAQSELADLIFSEITRMNDICIQLLLTAKLKSGGVQLRIKEVNVRDLIDRVVSQRVLNMERNPIRVEIDNLDLSVGVDEEVVAMSIAQYLDNACKYSFPNTPITISASANNSEVLISVHNFGPTIPMEDRERIFERFYRSSNTERTEQGTGIGLSFVRKAAEAHHAHAWVVSEEKEGTTFSISVPAVPRRNAE